MPDSELYPVGCSLSDVIIMLGYSFRWDRDIVLSTMLRNASDSNDYRVQQTVAEGRSPAEVALSIRVAVEPETCTLVVKDSGVGCTHDELARQVGNMLEILRTTAPETPGAHAPKTPEEHVQSLVLMVLHIAAHADQVTVESLSSMPGSRPVRLEYWGGDHCRIGDGSLSEAGTAVEVRLKPSLAHLCDEETVRSLLKQYGDYLEYPILWEGQQVNAMSPPWHQPGASTDDYASFLRTLHPQTPAPVLVLPVHMRYPGVVLRGALWVPGRHISVIHNGHGTLDIYWRRMPRGRQVQGFLPKWARFVSGIIDIDGPREELLNPDRHGDGLTCLTRSSGSCSLS